MLAPRDKLTICFAHAAYRMAEQFARRNTDIAHFQVHSLDEFKARIPEAHVVVVSMMWRNEFAESASKLQFIQSISAGLDQYDRDLLGRRRIRLASAAGVNAEAVAQHAMALILALKRQLHTGRDNQAAKVWRGMISEIGAREDQLNGKTLLIVGIGRIGSGLARLARAFEMRIIATRRIRVLARRVRTPSMRMIGCPSFCRRRISSRSPVHSRPKRRTLSMPRRSVC